MRDPGDGTIYLLHGPVLWALAWLGWSLLANLPGSRLLLRGRLLNAR